MNIEPAKIIAVRDEANIQDMGQKQAPAPSSDSINSNMSLDSQVVVGAIKPADRRTITGSYPGDSRADYSDAVDSSLAAIANPPGPRDAHTQTRLSSRTAPTDGPAIDNGGDSAAEIGD
jgi:hypothetical protein